MLKIIDFPPKKSQKKRGIDLLITSPHGCWGEPFFQLFPEILQHHEIVKKEKTFRNYLNIEHDKGASDIGISIARHFHESFGLDKRVVFVEILYPRGILDGGRLLSHCLRKSLPTDLMHFKKKVFLDIHDNTLVKIDELLEEVQAAKGRIIDIHTMAPSSPKEQVSSTMGLQECFANLDDYVSGYLETSNDVTCEKRPIDLMTQLQDGTVIADEQFAEQCLKEFTAYDLQAELNHPYSCANFYLAGYMFRKCRGLAIDVPKHLLAKDPQNFRLEDFEVCSKKAFDLGTHIFNAFVLSK